MVESTGTCGTCIYKNTLGAKGTPCGDCSELYENQFVFDPNAKVK